MPTRSTLVVAFAALAVACAAESPVPEVSGPQVAIAIAPLSLSGITNAEFRLTTKNASLEVVWTRVVSADEFGDGAGSVAYVGPCDATDNDNIVELVLLNLFEGANGDQVVDPGSYVNPTIDGGGAETPISRGVLCVANADNPVDFAITIARSANQGFFDVAVNFEDIFCSAKLDCERDSGDLDLLHHPHTGERDMTVVLGFACTAGGGAETTVLYLDNLVIECTGAPGPIVVDVTGGPGNLNPTFGNAPNSTDLLFQTATYRGSESLGFDSIYWNVALGLNEAAFDGLGTCRVTTAGTASNGLMVNGATPAEATYPFVGWDVELIAGGVRTCSAHPVDVAGSGVATQYGESVTFDAGYTGEGAPFSNGSAPICGDGNTDAALGETCDDGGTVPGDGCDENCHVEATARMFFVADDGTHGRELWASDCTVAGTTMVADIDQGGVAGFSYNDCENDQGSCREFHFEGCAFDENSATYCTSGTFDTQACFANESSNSCLNAAQVCEFDPSFSPYCGSSGSSPERFVVYDGALYFSASGPDGRELYRYDGTAASQVADIDPAGDGMVAYPTSWGVVPREAAFNGKLYFHARNPTVGEELFVYDGTNVTVAYDADGGAGSSVPEWVVATPSRLYFVTNNGPDRLYAVELDGSVTEITIPTRSSQTVFGSVAVGDVLVTRLFPETGSSRLAVVRPGSNVAEVVGTVSPTVSNIDLAAFGSDKVIFMASATETSGTYGLWQADLSVTPAVVSEVQAGGFTSTTLRGFDRNADPAPIGPLNLGVRFFQGHASGSWGLYEADTVGYTAISGASVGSGTDFGAMGEGLFWSNALQRDVHLFDGNAISTVLANAGRWSGGSLRDLTAHPGLSALFFEIEGNSESADASGDNKEPHCLDVSDTANPVLRLLEVNPSGGADPESFFPAEF